MKSILLTLFVAFTSLFASETEEKIKSENQVQTYSSSLETSTVQLDSEGIIPPIKR